MTRVSIGHLHALSVFFVCIGVGVTSAQAGICDGISPAPSSALTKVTIATGLTKALFVTSPPADVDRLLIVEQGGKIKLVKGGALLTTPFLDVTSITLSPANGGGNEQGLLGMAFHPGYASNGWVFVYHTDMSGNNVVERYTRSASNPDTADSSTRQVVLTLSHPGQNGHNGGMIEFGPNDGNLYIGVGDGALNCAPLSYTSNWGKILRIDVDSMPYAIPPDNPYRGVDGRNDEIWSIGLRNPWRWSFDRQTADLIIGDVGESQWEELEWQSETSHGGEDYGWPNYEGNTCSGPCPGTTCTLPGYVAPVVAYPHTEGCAIVGGYVYRGCRMPDLDGTYFYSDFCQPWMKTIRFVNGVPTSLGNRTTEIGGIANVKSFGEDARGELYYAVDSGSSTVYKIVPILPNLEVSGPGAAALLFGKTVISWEDLHVTSGHPISSYHVLRSSSRGGGTFDCVLTTSGTSWTGGDPASPATGGIYSYLVVALNATGQSTSTGTGASGQQRTVSSVSCP